MNSPFPRISVIMPCYNAGFYLSEAVQSVRASDVSDYEIIIVDDGSTDATTINVLADLEQQDYKIVRQKNSGPASARNTGVRASRGEYLFFLDSDNKIRPDYLRRGVAELIANERVGVVFGNPNFFGDSEEPRFTVEPFDMDRMMVGNYIDMCSMVRKKVWEEVGGFDEERILIGYEDWDFWIRVGLTSWKFKYLNDVLFDYRIRNNSLMATIDADRKRLAVEYISKKHSSVIFNRYKYFFRLNMKFQARPLLYFLKIIYSKYILRKKYIP